MLAKEIKIRNIVKQREFIRKKLEGMNRIDGNTLYTHIGHIFPEVLKYFKEEGFDVEITIPDGPNVVVSGSKLYLFSINDNISLSEEELEMAEKIAKNDSDEDLGDQIMTDIFNKILNL